MDQLQSMLHHRRSIRLPGYDYSSEGAYFVTICTHERQHLFGEIVGGNMILNEIGKIVLAQWQKIPGRFMHVELDEFIVMPNHLHGILIINDWNEGHPQGVPVRAGLAPALGLVHPSDEVFAYEGCAPKLGDIIGAYKSLVANDCLKSFKSRHQTMGKIWHRNYYEHIITTDHEYEQIAEYIYFNPQNWQSDSEYSQP